MSDILIDIFPLDVIDNVLLFLSKKALKTFFQGLTEHSILRELVLSRIYEVFEVYKLDQLVEAASLHAPVGMMGLQARDDYLTFFIENPTFVSNISDVYLLLGCFHDYKKWREIPFRSISCLVLKLCECFNPSDVPHNLKLIVLYAYQSNQMELKGWPPSLTCMTVENHTNLKLIDLPRNLKELSCLGLGGLWDLLPPKLETFRLLNIKPFASNQLLLPESLQELLISRCPASDTEELMSRLPNRLKRLNFHLCKPVSLHLYSFPESLEVLLIRCCCVTEIEMIVATLPVKLKNFQLKYRFSSKLASLQFPDSLKVLNLSECGIESLEGIIFPKCLVELELGCNKINLLQNLKFPESLMVLNLRWNKIMKVDSCEFPESLTVLNLDYNVITTIDSCEFPESLTVLNLEHNRITTIDSCKFPESLTVLNLDENKITMLDCCEFPESLRVLNLEENKVRSLKCDFPGLRKLHASNSCLTRLDGVKFPKLEVLDISTESTPSIRSMRNVKFPSTLRILRASGHCVSDFRQTSLPASLRELAIKVRGNPLRLSFPPKLRVLELTFLKKSKVALLNLPETLEDLTILNGTYTEFDWKLPYLRKLDLDFRGRVKIPPSVNNLTIVLPQDKQWREHWRNIVLTHELKYLWINEYIFQKDLDGDMFKFIESMVSMNDDH
ncbi:CIC11C00000003199 [Sungouiella intermedia]|uniref:CIC11C00000003199 n=1 Tax=Sungouiella intermedia TaxID=45354 RepID=A0A1L0C120_9ASCO|nr:CIC11C00000003199 [[Candida] intermedia]